MEGVGVYTGPDELFLAETEAEGGVVLLLAEVEAEGVGVLSLSAAGAGGVHEGEGVALPFSAVAGTTLAGVDKVLAWSCFATGLTLGELFAVPTVGELTAEEEEEEALLGEGVRVRTSLKETFGETL